MKTIHRGMIETLRRGLKALGPYADTLIDYTRSLQNPDGGFRGRTGKSDLYYTVFAVDILSAAGADCKPDMLIQYLDSIPINTLDFIHLCSLVRCKAGINRMDEALKRDFMKRIKRFLCRDGLYHHVAAGQNASVYGIFLIFSASQDLKESLIEPQTLLSNLVKFRHPGGSYKNECGQGAGTLPPTAAVIAIQTQLGISVEKQTIDWIFSCLTEEGGFAVSPRMPIADLLSTATALQALRYAGADISPIRERCRNYVGMLVQNSGGFCANLFDPTVDAEYTFYGLLAAGSLEED